MQLWSKCWKVIVDGEAREETWHDSSALQPVTRVMMMTVKGVNRAGLCSTGLVTRAGDLCCHDQPNTVISSALPGTISREVSSSTVNMSQLRLNQSRVGNNSLRYLMYQQSVDAGGER